MNKLIDYCLSITDDEHATVPFYADGKHFLLSARNLQNGKVVLFDNERSINEAEFLRIRKRTKLKKNDVLISTTGTIENVAIANECEYYDFNRDVAMIKCDSSKLLPE